MTKMPGVSKGRLPPGAAARRRKSAGSGTMVRLQQNSKSLLKVSLKEETKKEASFATDCTLDF